MLTNDSCSYRLSARQHADTDVLVRFADRLLNRGGKRFPVVSHGAEPERIFCIGRRYATLVVCLLSTNPVVAFVSYGLRFTGRDKT